MTETSYNRTSESGLALMVAIDRLNHAGYLTTPVGDVPGLYDVLGKGADLTIGQVIDIANRLNA